MYKKQSHMNDEKSILMGFNKNVYQQWCQFVIYIMHRFTIKVYKKFHATSKHITGLLCIYSSFVSPNKCLSADVWSCQYVQTSMVFHLKRTDNRFFWAQYFIAQQNAPTLVAVMLAQIDPKSTWIFCNQSEKL